MYHRRGENEHGGPSADGGPTHTRQRIPIPPDIDPSAPTARNPRPHLLDLSKHLPPPRWLTATRRFRDFSWKCCGVLVPNLGIADGVNSRKFKTETFELYAWIELARHRFHALSNPQRTEWRGAY
jgi:hypothetical protein